MRKIIIGIDEVGLGAWAGPIYVAAVCFISNSTIPPDVIIRDSKAMNRAQRVRSSFFLRKNTCFVISRVSREIIDTLGVRKATIQGIISVIRKMRQKIRARLTVNARTNTLLHFQIDGKKICSISESHEFIVRGDGTIAEISAASIMAKVARDRHMKRLGTIHPEYGFANHVGYGTREHQRALNKYGICDIHRRSYAPIKKVMHSANKVVVV